MRGATRTLAMSQYEPLTLEKFRSWFKELVKAQKVTWQVLGFYTASGKVYPIGTDTKVLSTVFEAFCAPLIAEIASAGGYEITFAKQTVYPDFTLTPRSKSESRIAIDVKSTYQQKPTHSFKFTLGSYKSYLRNNTKNIVFPYDQYCAHWVIGFVYQRKETVPAKVYDVKDVRRICPYSNVRFFIQDKYKVAGKSPGSGNTTNIGSFPTRDIRDLAEGKGPFAELGEDAFEQYWRTYGA